MLWLARHRDDTPKTGDRGLGQLRDESSPATYDWEWREQLVRAEGSPGVRHAARA